MARTLRDSKLDSREARAKLKVRGKPYWRLLEGGLHLGYRRLSKRPGTWCVRRYVGEQRYAVEALEGVADDYSEADGVTVLSFAMAQRKALDHKPKPDGPLTVGRAVESYLEFLTTTARAAETHATATRRSYARRWATCSCRTSPSSSWSKWRDGLAAMPRRLRTPKGEQPRYAPPDDSDEGKRKRQSLGKPRADNFEGCAQHGLRQRAGVLGRRMATTVRSSRASTSSASASCPPTRSGAC